MSTALSRVMDAAAESAQGAAPAAGLPTQYQSPVPVPVQRPSLDSMADSVGIQVDQYLTVKDTGFRLGDNKAPIFSELEGIIDVSQVAAIVSARATNAAGATTFIKSYDGVMTSTGQNFQQALQGLQATHTKVDGPYQTVEVPLTLTKPAGGVEKGKVVGITPSITGAKFWSTFYKSLREQGLQRATVAVKVTHLPQTNKSGNEWGVPQFELVSVVEPSE